eukprot:CAMPEP_0195021814 /NCGR_PEP_ID=MMETSP0326_2-20130528/38858_1 /TAXON_ID=2866 ORGANISM="Crypthecodinium cohnii, Strain Seligo" /NCGR_SAMPLE_ID=MMETSP0326_2 /ASSEMBLY_ACC=CAM_ASM_000348 /LENGTH=123 /DNA_ID=CAMNT_0040041203 /DNA_START=442 /DNA_END=814 /DNA_ORIENTATION=+
MQPLWESVPMALVWVAASDKGNRSLLHTNQHGLAETLPSKSIRRYPDSSDGSQSRWPSLEELQRARGQAWALESAPGSVLGSALGSGPEGCSASDGDGGRPSASGVLWNPNTTMTLSSLSPSD